MPFSGERPHQVRLQGGDASSDSYCFPNSERAWPWILMALLGAYHGLNPAMGWLFAVGLGLQERDRKAVLRALPPIAIGHELAIAVVVVVVLGLEVVADAGPSARRRGRPRSLGSACSGSCGRARIHVGRRCALTGRS